MANYSISYFTKEKQFAYVDSRTYNSAQNAIVRAILHLNSSSDCLGGAAIIYQGKKVQKRVRTIQFWNNDPNHQ